MPKENYTVYKAAQSITIDEERCKEIELFPLVNTLDSVKTE